MPMFADSIRLKQNECLLRVTDHDARLPPSQTMFLTLLKQIHDDHHGFTVLIARPKHL